MRVESVEDYVNHMSHDSLAKMMQGESNLLRNWEMPSAYPMTI